MAPLKHRGLIKFIVLPFFLVEFTVFVGEIDDQFRCLKSRAFRDEFLNIAYLFFSKMEVKEHSVQVG